MTRPQLAQTELLSVANRVAEEAHRGQVDKGGAPYIGHPRRVARRVAEHGGSVEQQAAALLHDVLEDTPTTTSDLRELGFSDEVVATVVALTKLEDESHEEAVRRAADHPHARLVKRCDIEDNSDPARLARLGPPTRTRLEQKYERAKAMLERPEGEPVTKAHYVYLFRHGSGKGRPMYVGYGSSVERAMDDRADNPKLDAWLATASYTIEVAGPYRNEDEGREVEAALISALDPDLNRIAGIGHKFAPLGVPPELGSRTSQPPLSLAEIGRVTGGALLVYLAPGTQLSDGRVKYDPADPDDRTIISNIEGVWDIGRHLDAWRAQPDDGPQTLLGIYGPNPQRRFIVGAARIDTDRWGESDLEVADRNRWRVPLSAPVTLDACELRGRRVDEVKFSYFSHLLHIWVDAIGQVRHPEPVVT